MTALVERRDGIGHIIINRPAARNALNQATVAELTKAFQTLSADSSIRVVLFSGQGTEAFCAGADLKELDAATTPEAKESFFGGVRDLVESISRCAHPVVGKVHGFALAGGCGLAAACDLVLAADDATFGLPEINLGLLPMIVMAPIGRVIGPRALADLVLTGRRVGAVEAAQLGLVTRVIAKEDLDREGEACAAELAGRSPVALRAAKKTLHDLESWDYFDSLPELTTRVAELAATADGREGVKAFLEKRKAVWLGK